MTATIGFTGGAGSTATININGAPVVTVGANGIESGIPSISGFRNKLINGGFVIDQRNAGATKAFSASWPNYGADRWSFIASAAVSGTLTGQRVAGDGNSQYALQIAKTTGTYTGSLYAVQIIETANCFALSGKTVTLSFRARVGSTFSGTTTPYKLLYTGTGTDEGGAGGISSWAGASSRTATTVSNPTLTTAFQTYKFTYNIPAGTTEIAVLLGRTTDATAGSANDYIDITDAQLEVGAVATPFETRAYGQEFLLCQRYFQTVTLGKQCSATGSNLQYSPLPVTMRSSPTVANVSAGTVSNCTISSEAAGTNFYNLQINVTVAGGFVTGRINSYSAEL